MEATAEQIHVLQHTLGLCIDRRVPYRNHFVAALGHHDMPALEVLEAQGLMRRVRSPAFLDEGDIVFAATEAGRELAILSLPPVPKRTRYRDFLGDDGSQSFGEFLCGIRLPKVEADYSNGWRGKTKYRMYRETWENYRGATRDVQGEWRETKKDAKASYKEALAAHRGFLKALDAPATPADGEVQNDASEQDDDRSQRGG